MRRKTSNNKPTEPSKPNIKAITIYNGLHEIRTYSLETHGDQFTALANEFLSKHKEYTITTS